MSAVQGAGLLALLARKRTEPEQRQHPSAGGASGMFEARSSAVYALEHAVAANTASEPTRAQPQGRLVLPGRVHFTYDVDASEVQPQLSVTPITLINTEFALHHWRQIAVSDGYICYGLKQGHIRVLSRHSAARALLKGHTKPLTDLQFAPSPALGGSRVDARNGAAASGSLLASGGLDGVLHVWLLHKDAVAIHNTQRLCASFLLGPGSAGDVLISWHGPSQHVLAVGVGGRVLLLATPDGTTRQLEVDLDGDSTSEVIMLREWGGEAVSCLAFSPDGQLLAVGGVAGCVRVWEMRDAPGSSRTGLVANRSAVLPISACGGAIGSISWLPSSDGWVLLTGNHNNAVLQLWHSAGCGRSWQMLQEIRLEGTSGQQELYNNVGVVAAQRLVVLADAARKAVYTLHYSGGGADVRFNYVACFGVAVPILSFAALWNPAGGEQGDPQVEINCVQTTAVQQYSLDPALCCATADDAAEAGVQEDPRIRKAGEVHPAGPAAQLHASGVSGGAHGSSTLAEPAAKGKGATAQVEGPVTVGGDNITAPSSPTSGHSAGRGMAPSSVPPLPTKPAMPHPPKREASAMLLGGSGLVPPTASEQQRPADAAACARAGARAVTQQSQRLLTPSDLFQPVGETAVIASVNAQATTHTTEQATPQEQRSALLRPVPGPAIVSSVVELATQVSDEKPVPVAAAQDMVAASALEQMGGVHKKFVGHVSLMYRELLKALKAELRTQAAAQQQATAQLLAAAMEVQKQQVEAERAAVLAEERASLEHLLTAISATLNRDLPSKLAEVVRGEMEGMATGLAAALGPIVQTAFATSMSEEVLAAAVKLAHLDRAIAPTVATRLAKPLQEALRSTLSEELLPVFEGATQVMFQQINAAFTAGFEEHVQASKSALFEPVKLATQLADSLGSAQALAALLSQGRQQLLQLQSSVDSQSPVAAADVRSELSLLLRAGNYEQAFCRALGLQDVATVGWLASQTDATVVLGSDPCPVSQMVLLSLVQQLSADLTTYVGAKLAWICEAAMLINPADPALTRHLRPVLEGVYGTLQAAAGALQGAEASRCRLAMHVVHSQLTSC